MRIKKFFQVMVVTAILITGCSSLTDEPYKKTDFLMGTVVTVKIYDRQREDVLQPAFETIQDLTDRITTELDSSETSQINRSAGIEPIQVSDELFYLITEGKKYSAIDAGGFDITIGPITNLWRIGHQDARKPAQRELDNVLSLVDYTNIILDEQQQTVFLKDTGMELDLGAIAKGYIADEIVQVLTSLDVTTAVVDLGGNIVVLGRHPSGKPWTGAIQDPFSPRGETMGKLTKTDRSIVTSGIYERYVEVDGVKYQHLLNPKDGYPFTNELASVTIVSETSIAGDALSTVVFSMGLEAGLQYIEALEDTEAILVNMDHEVFKTSWIEIFTITNDQFRWGYEIE